MMKRKNAVLTKTMKGGGLNDRAGDQRHRKKET